MEDGLRGHHLKLKVHRYQTPGETGFLQSACGELVEQAAVISDRGDICQHVQDASGRLDVGCGHSKLLLLSTTLQVQVQVEPTCRCITFWLPVIAYAFWLFEVI